MESSSSFATGLASSRGQTDSLLLRGSRSGYQPSTDTLVKQLASLAKRFDQVMAGWNCDLEDVLFVRDLAAKIVELVGAHPEICLGIVRHIEMRSQSIAHDLRVAVVAALTAQTMDLGLKQQLTAVRAALVMNLSTFEMHDNLAYSSKELTLSQRVGIVRHPLLAAEYLSHSAGADMQWIDAVEQHHESMDGTGYPVRLSGQNICLEARLVKAADLWCSLVSPRATRREKYPHHAMQELQLRERLRLDFSVLTAMRRRLGNYPPGTLVRLASRETAMVTGFTQGNRAPRYAVAIFNPAGEIMAVPKLRDTSKMAFAQRGYAQLPQEQAKAPDWTRVWALVHGSLLSIPKEARIG